MTQAVKGLTKKRFKEPYSERDEIYHDVLAKYRNPGEKSLLDIFHRMADCVTNPNHPIIIGLKKNYPGLSNTGFLIHKVSYQTLMEAFLDGLMPQGSILYGLGNVDSKYVSVSNCYFLRIEEDSLEGIMETAKKMAITYKYRGGVGIDLSVLRPKNSPVSNSAKTSSGAASFMNMYSEITKTIGQAGRRGALMLTIDISHPDVEQFILMKQKLGVVEGANVSVKLSDSFMRAVVNDDRFFLEWKNRVHKEVRARELFDLIVKCAHSRAEPGVIFWDRVLEYGCSAYYDQLRPEGTNPCSEIPMSHGDACTLASQYMPRMVLKPYSDIPAFDNFNWKLFEHQIRIGVNFLDVLKDIDNCPFDFQREMSQKGRRIGLGMHGIADMLVRLGLVYGSPEAIKFCEYLSKFKKNIEYNQSARLAKDLGVFPLYNKNLENSCSWLMEGLLPETIDLMDKYGRRNVQLGTMAPTGSISILCNNCSSSGEPIYLLDYLRTTRLGSIDKEHRVFHPEVKNYLKIKKIKLKKNQKLEDVLPPYFITTYQIKPIDRVLMQAAFGKYIDHSISSTVNLPENSSLDDVRIIILEAWKNQCKGITVYRKGSREGILRELNDKQQTGNLIINLPTSQVGQIRERPNTLPSLSHRIKQGDYNWYLTVTYANNLPFDVMATSNNDHRDQPVEDSIFNLKSICKKYKLMDQFQEQKSKAKNSLDLFMRLISLLLRSSIPIDEIFDENNLIINTIPWHVKNYLKPLTEMSCLSGNCN